MKRGKCLVNCIELDIPLAVLTDIIPLPENQNVSEVKPFIVTDHWHCHWDCQ